MMITLNIVMAICLFSGGLLAGLITINVIERHVEKVEAKKEAEERLVRIEKALTKLLDKGETK